MTVTNQGGVHAFNGRRWRTLSEANDQVNYQVYSFLNVFDRALLEKYLAQYTGRNTMDYFIHKDLGAFLRRDFLREYR